MGNYFGLLVGCLVLFGGGLNCNAQSWTTEEWRQVTDLQSAFRTDDQHLVLKSEPWGPEAYYDVTIENVCGGDVEKWANKFIKPEINLKNLNLKNLAKYGYAYSRDRLVLIKATLEFGQNTLPDVIDKKIYENSNTWDAFFTCENDLKFWGIQNDKKPKVTLKIKVVDRVDTRAQKVAAAAQTAGASGFAWGGFWGLAGAGLLGTGAAYFLTDSVTQKDLEDDTKFSEHVTSVTIGEIRRGRRVTGASLTSDTHKEWIKISRVRRY